MRDASILVLGAGVAGTVTGLLLRRHGYSVVIASRPSRSVAALESLAESGVELLRLLDLGHLLHNIGAQSIIGFGGHRFHIFDRARLAAELGMEVSRAGVSRVLVPRLLKLSQREDGIDLTMGETFHRFDFVVDATGRLARISRPVTLHRLRIADLYSAPTSGKPTGNFHRNGDEWAYQLDNGIAQTVGIVSGRRRVRPRLPAYYVKAFGAETTGGKFLARLVGSAQWAALPVDDRRISVGDAALAHEPIGGLGIKFALASARAALAVIRTTLSRPSDARLARQFYVEFVRQNRDGHLKYVRQFEAEGADRPHDISPLNPHDLIQSIGRVEPGPIIRDGLVCRSEVLRNADGTGFRWVGGLDVMLLVDACRQPTTVNAALQQLASRGMRPDAARQLIEWGLRCSLLKVNRCQ